MFFSQEKLTGSYRVGRRSCYSSWCLLGVPSPDNEGLLLKKTNHCDFPVRAVLLSFINYYIIMTGSA